MLTVLLCVSAFSFAFYSISLPVTALATALVIFRVVSVVKQTGGIVWRYAHTAEDVMESGLLYAIALVVTPVFLVEGCCLAVMCLAAGYPLKTR